MELQLLDAQNESQEFEFNGEKINIKTYLPISQKLELIGNVLNQVLDENGFYNPVKVDVYGYLEIIQFYTDVTFPDGIEVGEAYDTLIRSGLLDFVISKIPEEEYDYITKNISESIQNYYSYKASFVGSLEAVSNSNKEDLEQTEAELEKIQKMVSDPESLTLVKDVLSKMG